MTLRKIVLSLLASGVSFPAMLFERTLPNMPTLGLLETEGTKFHKLKNNTTEMFRRDSQWWSKASCFCVLILTAAFIAALFH